MKHARETKPETKQTILQAHLEALGACREAREWAGAIRNILVCPYAAA